MFFAFCLSGENFLCNQDTTGGKTNFGDRFHKKARSFWVQKIYNIDDLYKMKNWKLRNCMPLLLIQVLPHLGDKAITGW